MDLWSSWPQRERPEANKLGRSRSFASQMAEIGGELERMLSRKGKLEQIRADRDYVGEPQVIQRIFASIKEDPKNTAFLQEVTRAEQETFAFLSGAPNAPSITDVRKYWDNYLQAYLAELEQNDR